MASDSPLAERLMEGFARAAGATGSVEEIEARKKRRQDQADKELEMHTKTILDDMSQLRQRRMNLPEGSPEIGQIDKAMEDAQKVFYELYHPERNPGNLGRLGGYLQRHLPGLRRFAKPQAPRTPAEAKQTFGQAESQIGRVAYAPGQGNDNVTKYNQWQRDYQRTQGKPPDENEKQRAWMHISMGSPYEEKPEQGSWSVVQDVPFPDGKKYSIRYNAKNGEMTYLDGSEIPEETKKQLSFHTGKQAGQTKLTGTDLTRESFESSFVPPVKWEDMAPEQRAFFEEWKELQKEAVKTSQHIIIGMDNGKPVPYRVTTVTETSHPGISYPPGYRQPGQGAPGKPAPAAPAASPTAPAAPQAQGLKVPGKANVPKTPAQAKTQAPRPAARTTPKAGIEVAGPALGWRPTPAQTKAQEEWQDSAKLDAVARQVERNPNDAVNQKSLLVSLERARAGRFTTQALDYIIRAGLGNSIEGWAKSFTTGALPADVMRQAIDGAHQLLNASDAAWYGSGAPPERIKELKLAYEQELRRTTGVGIGPQEEQDLMDDLDKMLQQKKDQKKEKKP